MQSISQSPTDAEFVQDPYPFYKHARSLGDFVEWTDYGMTMATTQAAVSAVLKHPHLGRPAPEEDRTPSPAHLTSFYRVEANSLLEREPPDHTRLRSLVLRAFTRNRILHLAPEISRIADELIDAFPDGPFDIIDAYARPMPIRIICRLLGVPEDMGDQLQAWSNDMVAMYQARRDMAAELRAEASSTAFTDFMHRYIEKRRKAPRQDLLSDLIAAEQDGEKLSTDELIATCILLLNAGHEATVHAIGNSIRHLTEYPEKQLAIGPDHIAGTVEECLRFDPPLHMFTRYVYQDVGILGQQFRRGDKIGCLLASACRDDAVWPDGETLDPFRAVRTNLSFGAGIHFCVGAPLARMEMQIALPALFSRCRSLKLAEEPRIADLYHFRGLERLIVSR